MEAGSDSQARGRGDVGPGEKKQTAIGPIVSNGLVRQAASVKLISNIAKNVVPSKEVGRVNSHIRFRLEDSDLSDYSDSVGDIG